MIQEIDGSVTYSHIEMRLAYLIMQAEGIATNEEICKTLAWRNARKLIAMAQAEPPEHASGYANSLTSPSETTVERREV